KKTLKREKKTLSGGPVKATWALPDAAAPAGIGNRITEKFLPDAGKHDANPSSFRGSLPILGRVCQENGLVFGRFHAECRARIVDLSVWPPLENRGERSGRW